jgi:hypothetical protein
MMTRVATLRWTLAAFAVLGGCADSERERSLDAGPVVNGAIDGGDTDGVDADGVDPSSRLKQEARFWDAVEICGEWVEAYPTLTRMADAADAVLVGRMSGVAVGNTVQGDAPEDFYAEVNLRIDVDEILRHTVAGSFELSLVLPTVFREQDLEPAVDALRADLPADPMVLLVRERSDFEGVFILVNDRALWTRTTRGALDNPIDEQCHGPVDEQFLEGVATVEELIDHLRP